MLTKMCRARTAERSRTRTRTITCTEVAVLEATLVINTNLRADPACQNHPSTALARSPARAAGQGMPSGGLADGQAPPRRRTRSERLARSRSRHQASEVGRQANSASATLSNVIPQDFINAGLDSLAYRDLRRTLRGLPERERLDFILGMGEVEPKLAWALANACLRRREHVEAVFRHGFLGADAHD